MKNITTYLVTAILFAIVGIISLTVARLQRHMADAQEQIATLRYEDAQASLDAAESYLEYAQWLPGVGDDALKEVRTRKAALLYWQGDYEAVLPAQAEPVAAVDESNAALQLVVANAAFRAGLSRAKERAETLQSLNEAVNGYAIVLKNDTWNEDAAHNYEYVVRLRDDIAKGRRPPTPQPEQGADLGEGGAPSPSTTTKGFEIYIPLEGNERTPASGEAGKAEAKQRKG
jgi:type II secretory pathway pseudopilin PulG